ncbi:hypothetical protein LZ30DRAFT_684782 [Colletotrichum cereale]|nr:hypothetical protein LZ30DRAFT_684782 [Colletotrichum cereale]
MHRYPGDQTDHHSGSPLTLVLGQDIKSDQLRFSTKFPGYWGRIIQYLHESWSSFQSSARGLILEKGGGSSCQHREASTNLTTEHIPSPPGMIGRRRFILADDITVGKPARYNPAQIIPSGTEKIRRLFGQQLSSPATEKFLSQPNRCPILHNWLRCASGVGTSNGFHASACTDQSEELSLVWGLP